jgi:hypothetical protein
MNLPSYDILQIKFIKPMSSMGIMDVKKDFSHIPIDAIYLVFSCNYHMNDNEWITYVIKPNEIEPKGSGICQPSHSSPQLVIKSTKTV